MRWIPVALVSLATACVPIYDEQLADRRDELDEHRRVFLQPEARVQFVSPATHRVFWVELGIPLNEEVLRSLDATLDAEPVTYGFDLPTFDLEAKLAFGDELVVVCPSSGDKQAYDATVANQPVGAPLRDPFQGGACAVSGNTVYIIRNDDLVRWVPSTGAADIVVDLSTTGIGAGSIAGFAVHGDRLVFAEGGRLWLLDLANPTAATWLGNEDPPEGAVVINDRGILYRVSLGRGAFFIRLPEQVEIDVASGIEDGGYRLNALHGDIHLLADREDNVLFGDQIVYRGQGGIFAYGIDTGKVQDILLDSEELRYFEPVVVETGDLYVEQRTNSAVTIFTVQLSDVLR